jgi:hypothetical protein
MGKECCFLSLQIFAQKCSAVVVRRFLRTLYVIEVGPQLWQLIFVFVLLLQDKRKFQQRYYEFVDYFKAPDSPIFLRICGESTCSGITNDYNVVRATTPRKLILPFA